MITLRPWVCSARLLGPAFAMALLAALMAPAVTTAHQGHEHGNVIANADGDNVRLRSGPSYDDGEITRFPEGTGVDIIDGPYDAADASIWYQVDIDGQVGYMDSAYLVAVEVATDEPADEGTTEPGVANTSTSGLATTNDSVYLRSGPSTADAVIRTLDMGEQVTLTGRSREGWTSVSATGGDGWVSSDYLAFPNAPIGTRSTLDTVHLRSGPGTQYDSITYLEVGIQLELTGGQEGTFVEVSSPFGDGWVAAEYIGPAAAETPETPVPTPESEPAPSGNTGTRYTIDTVHLRAGPSTEFDSITYLDAGVELQLTGDQQYGFEEVLSPFGGGWVSTQYIGASVPQGPETPPEPAAPVEPETPAESVARFTTANVNLRTAASQASTVETVIASGTEVAFSGETDEGFAQVRTTSGDGWIAAAYLSDIRPEEPAGPEPVPAPAPSGSLITWPVAGDEWVISQGYNGSSHQNRTSSWQYYYSLDLKRSDGATAGQPVYSAVDGTVRWIDEATGGMSIYMGDGLAYAYFHTRIDPGIEEGDTIIQGQYMGTIAPAGEAGSGSSAHLHITIWETSDEGNWSRRAIPFTGNVAIEGVEFPATGAGNDHLGYTFTP